MARATRVLTGDIWFGEGPRWRDGRLWFSDFVQRSIRSVSLAGELRTEIRVGDSAPSGLGWMPNGDLLFVAMEGRQLRRVARDGAISVHADLSGLSTWLWNDMVVDEVGRAWVGEFGFDFGGAMAARGLQGVVDDHPTARLACVQPDGAVELAAEDLHFPNGSVITTDGKILVVAETFACRLAAFDLGPGGALSNRREWAPLGGRLPDGICLDAEGAVWFANPAAPECVRVAEGGKVLEVIDTGLPCFACMLGGEDGRSLFMLTAPWTATSDAPAGRILVSEVDAAHAGRP
ncbi:MAG TPA: SMP-30/gluconolactonase/LRE family protein [Caulobacteraceae bacterium]|nr:SMP-30/gluconolactonase/LRE family protein [Caulobacteraceae bacterium]